MAVASKSSQDDIAIHLQGSWLAHCFDTTASGAMTSMLVLLTGKRNKPKPKPKPYIHLHTAQRLGCSPSQCLAFGHTSTGVAAAHSAGVQVMAVLNPRTVQQDFELAGDVMTCFDAYCTGFGL